MNDLGDEEFLAQEEAQVLGLDSLEHTIVSPGGSIVYAPAAVSTLKRISKVIYLEAPADWITEHTNPAERGIVGIKDRSFEELYTERQKLYEAMADYTISVPAKNPDALVTEIIETLGLG